MKGYLDGYLGAWGKRSELPTLRDLERDYIAFLLDMTAHNIAQVARILAVSRTAVYQKISRFGLRPVP